MARLIGPDEGSREVKTINNLGLFRSKAGRTATIYTDSGASSLADILTYPGGAAISGSQVTIDDYSMLPLIQFPDGVDTLYAVVDDGPVWPIYARTDDRLDTLATRVTSLEAGGAGDLLLVHKAGTETITGAKTFSTQVTVAVPSLGGHATTKTYVDTADTAEATARAAADTAEATARAAADTAVGAAAAAALAAHEADTTSIHGITDTADLVAKASMGWIVVTDTRWGASPTGSNPVAALAAATAGQTVYFPPGTYTPPTGVGNGYTVMADNVKIVAHGVTINVSTWGAAGIDCFNRSGVVVEGPLTVTYTGVRGNHLGAIYRGSAPYVNGCGVYVNRDRCRIEKLRTINMPVGVFLSSYNGTGASDRTGVNNSIKGLEVEGANFGILWVGQQSLVIDDVYGHDDIDDSSGANPTHVYYASGSVALEATDITISNVRAYNIVNGQPFQLKYCSNVRLTAHMARACRGLINGLDVNDLAWDGMGGYELVANGGQGAITFQSTTDVNTRCVLNNTVVSNASGVDERMVRLYIADSEISNMLLVSNRPGTPSNVNDYEFIVTGDNNHYSGVTVRSRGGHVRAFLLGNPSESSSYITLEDFICESTIGLVDVYTGGTDIHIKYNPGAQRSIVSGSNYIGTLGGSADYTVSRSEHERSTTLASGSATLTPNPYLETRTRGNVTDSSAITIAAPLGGTVNTGTTLEIVIANNSGGVMGSVSWNAAYTLLDSTYQKPDNGQATYHRFRYNGSSWVETAPWTLAPIATLAANKLTTGEVVPDRDRITSNTAAIATQTLYLTYFTARKSETISTLTMWTGGTAAATVTLIRMGVYSVAANGDLTLVASTANDTALFASTNTAYAKALQASWAKTLGTRYALGVLVDATTVPTFHGTQLAATAVTNTLTRLGPPIAGRLAGQTDLPSSVSVGSLVGSQVLLAAQMS